MIWLGAVPATVRQLGADRFRSVLGKCGEAAFGALVPTPSGDRVLPPTLHLLPGAGVRLGAGSIHVLELLLVLRHIRPHRCPHRSHAELGVRHPHDGRRDGRVTATDLTAANQAERPRLLQIAQRVLGDPAEAEDVVQQAWLRLHGSDNDIENVPGSLTTVTTRLCLDRLRQQIPVPEKEVVVRGTAPDPADMIALADTVGVALQVVLDPLTPRERVAFVLQASA